MTYTVSGKMLNPTHLLGIKVDDFLEVSQIVKPGVNCGCVLRSTTTRLERDSLLTGLYTRFWLPQKCFKWNKALIL